MRCAADVSNGEGGVACSTAARIRTIGRGFEKFSGKGVHLMRSRKTPNFEFEKEDGTLCAFGGSHVAIVDLSGEFPQKNRRLKWNI